jgi:hypothetical protein
MDLASSAPCAAPLRGSRRVAPAVGSSVVCGVRFCTTVCMSRPRPRTSPALPAGSTGAASCTGLDLRASRSWARSWRPRQNSPAGRSSPGVWEPSAPASVLRAEKNRNRGGDVLRFALLATLMSFILAACRDTRFERGATGAGGGTFGRAASELWSILIARRGLDHESQPRALSRGIAASLCLIR